MNEGFNVEIRDEEEGGWSIVIHGFETMIDACNWLKKYNLIGISKYKGKKK